MNPLVSIIIPTYNRADKIFNCLESILCQSYPNIEIIVVDDGSVDDTQKEIEAFTKEKISNERLFYYKQENQGAPTARNNGLIKAKGDFIVFFDSDDIMLPDRLLKQVKAMMEEDSDGCACGFINSLDGKEFIPNIDNEIGFIGSLLHWKLMGSTQSWMYKRTVLEDIGGYDTSYACYQDWDLTFRYLVHCQKISLVKESLSIFDDNERLDRITSQIHSEKRIPHIQQYYLKVIKWLVEEEKNYTLIDDVVFTYVHQITLSYYKTGVMTEAKNSYNSFIGVLKQSSLFMALICRAIFFKHLIKTHIKINL